MGAHVVSAEFEIISNLGRRASAGQGRRVRLLVIGASRAGGTRRADPREERRYFVLVGLVVDLNAVERRLREGHRGQGRPDLVADGDGQIVLPFLVGGYDQIAEETLEPCGLEQVASPLLGLGLAPVVDQPSSGDVRTIDVVEVVPFEIGRYIALVVISRVVAVLPLLPLIFAQQFLWDVPLFDRGV